METKQTAVEWFAMITKELGYVSEAQLKQAKEMEKQQIIDPHDNGYIDGGNKKKVTAEQYYKQMFAN
jgi:hypothetical protein